MPSKYVTAHTEKKKEETNGIYIDLDYHRIDLKDTTISVVITKKELAHVIKVVAEILKKYKFCIKRKEKQVWVLRKSLTKKLKRQ